MDLGIGIPSFASEGHRLPPDRLRRFARRLDRGPWAGAWVIEHLVRPPTYATSMLDPLQTLAVVAGETERVPLGTSVLLLPLRNPVMVAKRVATLQHLSSRRVTLGVGAGYVRAEFDAAGVPMDERSGRLREGLELVNRLLSEESVSFAGEYFSVDGLTIEPRPTIPPRLLAGGEGVGPPDDREVRPGVAARLAFADGWIAPPRQMKTLEQDWAALQAATEADESEKVALQYVHLVPGAETQARREQRRVYGRIVGAERPVEEAMTQWLSGTVAQIQERLAAYEAQGFDEVILYPVTHTPAGLERQLDRIETSLQPAVE